MDLESGRVSFLSFGTAKAHKGGRAGYRGPAVADIAPTVITSNAIPLFLSAVTIGEPPLQVVGEIHQIADQILHLRCGIPDAFRREHMRLWRHGLAQVGIGHRRVTIQALAPETLALAIFDERAHGKLPALLRARTTDRGAFSDSCRARALFRAAEWKAGRPSSRSSTRLHRALDSYSRCHVLAPPVPELECSPDSAPGRVCKNTRTATTKSQFSCVTGNSG